MIDTNCSNCKRPGQTLSAGGLCWNCYDSKEKQRYRYMVNSRTQLFFFTALLCLLFLLNYFPIVVLAHSFTKDYSKIENSYIKYGKDIAIFMVYAVLKLCFVVNIWKSRYQGVGSKYINLGSEAVLLIVKLGFMISYLANPDKWLQRLSGLTEKLDLYTEDTISSTYLSLLLVFSLIFILLRAFMCITAYILNIYYKKYYQEFYQNHPNSKRIQNIARWEVHYQKYPIQQQKNETLLVATKAEKSLTLSEEFLQKDLDSYSKDSNQLKRLIQNLLSQDDSISIKDTDLNLYFSYIKDKLSQWKEDNLAADNYLDTEIIADFITKYNSIKERFFYCSIENKMYFEIMNNFTNNFEAHLNQISNQRRSVKLMIEQLFTKSNLLYQSAKCKLILNDTLNLFDKQAINLASVALSIDDKVINFDNIIITNRGVFLIDIRTFDNLIPFDFVIERDGSWLKKIYDHESQSRLESLDSEAPFQNSRNLLIVEKLVNEELNQPLDQYIELKHIVIIANDELYIDNHSMQTIIRVGELMSTLRSFPIILNEQRMSQLEAILTKKQITSISYPIPNYRKLIIDQLEELLDKKQQLIKDNASFIHEVNVTASDLSMRHKLSFLPLIIQN